MNMFTLKRAEFSSDNKYFACFNSTDNLTVWETSTNTCIIDYKLDSKIYGICTSLYWIPLKPNQPSPKKLKSSKRNYSVEDQYLAIGTHMGAIVLYNITAKNLFSHLVKRHSDAINDMSFYSETNSFFTCSSDKSIAVWNITTGEQKSCWVADENPITSICVLDADNLLSASKSIFWWKISEKAIIKKFSGHSSEIFKLLAVNAELSLSSYYFLSGAISELRINAWSLSSGDCETPVATFVPNGQPQDMDISKISLKEKHLILSVVTSQGFLNLFEHKLNGYVNQPLHPKLTIEIAPNLNKSEVDAACTICTKFSSDSESCVVAYGDSKDNMTFKHIKIKDMMMLPLKNSPRETPVSKDSLPEVKESNKLQKHLPLNGLKSSSRTSEVGLKAAKLKDTLVNSPQKQVRSSNKNMSSDSSQVSNLSSENVSVPRQKKSEKVRTEIKTSNIRDPSNAVGILLEGIKTQNEEMINAVLQITDSQLISECVKNLPVHSFQFVLQELNSRLKQPQRFLSMPRIWIKEIFRIHPRYLKENKDSIGTLDSIKDFLISKRVSETLPKLSALRGLTSLLLQRVSSDESDSDSEETMES